MSAKRHGVRPLSGYCSFNTYIKAGKLHMQCTSAQGGPHTRGPGPSAQGTVLRFKVKVAVFQIFKCFKNWQKKISNSGFHLNWIYFIQKWSVCYRKFWKFVLNTRLHTNLCLIFGYFCYFTMCFSLSFFYYGRFCWVMSG